MRYQLRGGSGGHPHDKVHVGHWARLEKVQQIVQAMAKQRIGKEVEAKEASKRPYGIHEVLDQSRCVGRFRRTNSRHWRISIDSIYLDHSLLWQRSIHSTFSSCFG